MFRIRNFVSSSRSYDGSGRIVHGFYRDSFAAMYGLDVSSVDDECSCADESYDFLLPLVRRAAAGFEDDIRYFYDVRSSEEFGQISPDYPLLYGAGLNNVSPLCIRGNDDSVLLAAIQIALLDIDDDPALFCCSEIPCRYDRNFSGLMRASAFLLFRNS